MIIFDLDDTLRSTKGSEPYTPEALGLDPTRNENWVQWQEYVNEYGEPIPENVDLYETFTNSNICVVIITSSQSGTVEWLEKNNIYTNSYIEERPGYCHLSPFEYKKRHIDELEPGDITLWVDDNKEVCDYVESLGIPVVRVGQ